MTFLYYSAILVPLLFTSSHALDNGLGRVPPMGWNSWNKFGCTIHETLFREMTDLIGSLGLQELGYQYINIDDCWMAATRTPQGKYQADPQKFPLGIKALGDYVHSKGLLFGIYTSAGM